MSKLRVTSLTVQDVLGAKSFSMEPGKITVLSGKNGTGKSTALESIKTTFGGGSLAKLARINNDGEEIDPQIVMVIESDDGPKYLVEKNTKGTRVRSQIGDSAGFEDVPQPQRFLSGLFDNQMSNPIAFLNAAEKDRVLILLGALPVELDRKGLHSRMDLDEIPAVPEGIHPLQELSYLRKAIFDQRTGVNRDAKQKFATAEQTRRNSPSVLPDDFGKEIEALDAEISEDDKKIALEVEKAKTEYTKKKTLIQHDAEESNAETLRNASQKADKMRAELEEKIAKDQELAFVEASKFIVVADVKCKNLEKERDEKIESEREKEKSLIAKREKLAEMREQAKSAIKARALHEQADKFDIEATDLESLSKKLTAAISAIDDERRAMADNLPIPGLAVEDKEITKDGIPFDQLNTAQKMEIAVKISCLRAKSNKLPIVWVDGAEALDSENFDLLVKFLENEGVQAFIARVDDSNTLKIERRSN